MLSPLETKKLEEILKLTREIADLVREIRFGRKVALWAFGAVTVLVTMYDFWDHFLKGAGK